MKQLSATAPVRIDLAGGTLDLPPLFLFHTPTVTINAAIEVFGKVEIRESTVTKIISRDLGIEATWPNMSQLSWTEYPKLELILRLIKSFSPQDNLEIT